jgi:tRNA(fMet)-specific endonuclease VapC
VFIFDSDHLSIVQRQGPAAEYRNLANRLATYSARHFFVTIVSFHEQVNGWTAYVARARSTAGLVRGYHELEGILSDFVRAQVLPFSAAAADIYDDLRRSRLRVGPMDLRIASIAIANQMTLLTRNTVDFQRVPDLPFEDWTRS